MNGHIETCETLLYAGCVIDSKTKVDRTPLHLAAQEGHGDIVELLLKNGAEIEAKDMLHMTALHWAAERGHIPVIQVLLDYGASLESENKFKLTPIEVAEFKNHKDARDCMVRHAEPSRLNHLGCFKKPSFILTEEHDLIPAAPPVDEVIVNQTEDKNEIVSK